MIGQLDPLELVFWTRPAMSGMFKPVINLKILCVDNYFSTPGPTEWIVAFMLWPIALTANIGGALLVRNGSRARLRARIGKCVACGYDLSGLTPGSSCPECGKGKGA